MFDVILAFAAGVLTIAAPCVLPMLPIILGAAVGQTDSRRPIFITLGFTATFSLVAFVFGLFPSVLGLSQETLRDVGIIILFVFGLLMVWPHPFELLVVRLQPLLGSVGQKGAMAGTGKLGVFILGASLGVVWAPCAGPVLGSILTLIASAKSLGRAATLLVVYSIGAAIPMLLIGYGGRYVSTRVQGLMRYARPLQQSFGVVVILVAVAMFYQYDGVITVWLSNFYPDVSGGL